jgi:hypothetical protein
MKTIFAKSEFTRGTRSILPAILTLLTACSQDFGVDLKKLDSSNLPQFCLLADGSVVPSDNGDCSSGGGGPPLQSRTSTFDTASIQNKKIDVVMVIDNSGSMSTEQIKVRDGLAAVASQYLSHVNFTQNFLDVCVHVISSTYYKGTSQDPGFVGCTSNSSINLPNLVGNAVALGTNGSGEEALGKSLVSYLANKSDFNGVLSDQSLTRRADLRTDATLALVMVTDENNYFSYSNSSAGSAETFESFLDFQNGSGKNQIWDSSGNWDFAKNDIPSVTGKLRRATALNADLNNLIPDTRTGIKNYLEVLGFNLGKVTSLNFLKTVLSSGALVAAPLTSGPAMGDKNLFQLKSDLGNGSIIADIDANSSGYTAQFQNLFSNSVAIQSQLPLSPPAATTVGMQVFRVRGGVQTELSAGSFSIAGGGAFLQLNSQALNQILPGDQIKVKYFYQ